MKKAFIGQVFYWIFLHYYLKMNLMIKTIIFCLLLINFSAFSKDISILFVSHGFGINEKKELVYGFSSELSKSAPLEAYSDNLFFFETSNPALENTVKFTDYDSFEFDSNMIIKTAYKYKKIDLFIFIVKSEKSRGKGGNIGKNKIPVIGITSCAEKGVIVHEFAHSIYDLGDEYGGAIGFPPGNKELEEIKNLCLDPENDEWEKIKKALDDDKISYYEGGMGRNKGIFHSYPECLMIKTDNHLCPVCLYYSIMKLNNITGNNIDPFQYIHQDMNAKKSPVPIIKHLQ